MAKTPTLKTVVDGYFNKAVFNYNFDQIAKKFEEFLSRDGSTPNPMLADLDVSDANVTNVNKAVVNTFKVDSLPFTGFGEEYVYKLGQLECSAGAIITHLDGDPVCKAPGANGEVLKTSGSSIVWAEDIDTDTDTVGVTVQEDGVTVAENVTTIDFKWTGSDLVSTPAGNQVDLEMEDLLGPLFEDFNQNDTNLDPSSSILFNSLSEVRRVDLVTSAGLGGETTTAGDYYVVAEASNGFRDSGLAGGGPSAGGWYLDVRFYRADGTSTPLTGTEVTQPGTAISGNTAGGNLLTLIQSVPANVRYIDFAWSCIVDTPLFLNVANFSDRYRAVINGSEAGTFETPQGHTTQAARPTTTSY